MNLTLLKKEIKSNWVLLVIFLIVLSLYGTMVVAMFDPKLGESLQMMSENMPQVFAAFGMADVGTTLLEFVSGYLYGMLYVAFPSVFVIILSNRLVAKYVDNGSMAYLLSVPEKRRKIAFTQGVFLLLSILAMVVYIALLLLATGGIMFPGELEIPGFLRVNVGLLGAMVFFGGACFCASCFFNESKTSTSVGTAVVVYSVLLQMISQVGDKFEKLKYATPLTLFDVDGLAAGKSEAWVFCVILYVVGFVLMGVGIVRFSKRDLPL